MEHDYSEDFYRFLQPRVEASARACVGVLAPALAPASVLDVGCGRGTWLREWKAAGAARVVGVDAPSAEASGMLIAPEEFETADLEGDLPDVGRVDVAQSLEVAEHLTPAAGARLVRYLCDHADTVVFGAARRGQGGEGHVNEQPLTHWVGLFADAGFVPLDVLRPAVRGRREVLPWYRFNTLVYVRAHDGVSRDALRRWAAAVPEGGSAPWRLRCRAGSLLSPRAMDVIAQTRARILARRRRGA